MREKRDFELALIFNSNCHYLDIGKLQELDFEVHNPEP